MGTLVEVGESDPRHRQRRLEPTRTTTAPGPQRTAGCRASVSRAARRGDVTSHRRRAWPRGQTSCSTATPHASGRPSRGTLELDDGPPIGSRRRGSRPRRRSLPGSPATFRPRWRRARRGRCGPLPRPPIRPRSTARSLLARADGRMPGITTGSPRRARRSRPRLRPR